MKGKKNDFSMTFYNGDERRLFVEFVHDTNKAIQWVNNKGISWTHAMIYDRRTRAKIERVLNPNTEPLKTKINEIYKDFSRDN
ncbi:hypothetical protein [Empedobacter stercoris]|uniref:hypothetical protein n=1 Tax=Empedobacter stercoris TaxID=1628248 RepID=UPI0039E961BA